MNIKHLACSLLLLLSLEVQAQTADYLFLGKCQGVQLIPEDNDSVVHGRIPGWELSYGRSTAGNTQTWVRFFNAKHIEFSLNYLDLSQLHGFYDPSPTNFLSGYVPKGLGKQVSLLSSIKCQVVDYKGFNMTIVPGIGLAYNSSYYFKDTSNRYTGSAINFAAKVELQVSQTITKHWGITLGTRLMHSSNGGWLVPNAGINTWSVKAGLCYQFSE